MKKCTYIDGIASSQAIDTAGEIVDLQGLDISSLVGAAFNWEHSKSEVPAVIVGKILEAHKIFSEEDCLNERHRHFWNKCQIPFLYVMGRLFDDKKPSAVEVAALFQDDAENRHEIPMVSFSIEGARLGEKKGAVVKNSIARKVTITCAAANKTCVAEMLPPKTEAPGFESLFKGELTLFKYEPLEKREDKIPGGIGDKLDEKDVDPEQLKMGIKAELEHTSDESVAKEIALDHLAEDPQYYSKLATMEGKKDLQKALDAGSGTAAPSDLAGGAALAKEDMDKKMKKSQWYSRAEEAYKTWDKRPHFVEFMKKRLPHLAEGEVDAIGRVLALNKTVKAEKRLKSMYAGSRMEKSEGEYIHGLPKGHPALTEYKGHTLRRGREPKKEGGWHWKWHIRHPEGHDSVVYRPAETGGFHSDIHQHIDSTLKDKKK